MNIEKVPNKPLDGDFAVYEEVWAALYNSPHDVDEEIIVRGIAESKGIEKKELDRILLVVEEYKIFVNERLFNGSATNVSALIEQYNYEPTTDVVTVKLKYHREQYSMAVAVRDCTALSRHVFSNMFCVKALVVGIYDHDGIKISEKEYSNKTK